MLEDVKDYMTRWDAESARKKVEEENMMEEDDEGWTTVTKSSKLQVKQYILAEQMIHLNSCNS